MLQLNITGKDEHNYSIFNVTENCTTLQHEQASKDSSEFAEFKGLEPHDKG